MNKDNLQQQIDEMKAKLAEMEALLNQPVQTINYWHPENNDFYFYVGAPGVVDSDRYYSTANTRRYRVFKTKDEAQHYADYIKAEETLRKAIAEANKGWLPDWSSNQAPKTYVYLCTFTDKLVIETGTTHKILPTFMYIKSIRLATYLTNTYRKEFITYLSY